MSALHEHVRRTVRRHALLPPDARVLVGLSGGSDSVALTRLLLDLSEHGGFSVVGLAHLHHGLRAGADRDESFCRDLAARLGLPILVERAEVRSFASAGRLSIEDAARRLRYDFLERAADSIPADHIAVGHTRDDQAETFLLKLMRGAGLTGLGGIYPRRGRVIRPLLDIARPELRSYLAALGEGWVDDDSNADLSFVRNRVRHVVIPELDRTAGGPTSGALARAASLIRDDGQWLDTLAQDRFRELSREGIDCIELDIVGLAESPLPLRRRIVQEAIRRLAGGREVGLEHVESVLGLLGRSPSRVDVPGSRVELQRERLVFIQQRTQ